MQTAAEERVARGDISTACSILRTLVAFLWISFILSTVIFAHTVYVALAKPPGARSVSLAWDHESAELDCHENWSASFMDVSERGVVYGSDEERHGRLSDATFVEPSGHIQPKPGRSLPPQEPSGTIHPAGGQRQTRGSV